MLHVWENIKMVRRYVIHANKRKHPFKPYVFTGHKEKLVGATCMKLVNTVNGMFTDASITVYLPFLSLASSREPRYTVTNKRPLGLARTRKRACSQQGKSCTGSSHPVHPIPSLLPHRPLSWQRGWRKEGSSDRARGIIISCCWDVE